MPNNHVLAAVVLFVTVLGGCASGKNSIGSEAGLLQMGGGPKVYHGNIKRKYRVMKKVKVRLRQISGPNYYDQLNTVGIMRRHALSIGADAIINFRTKRIPGKIILFDPGYFELYGTAVKFTK